MKKILFLFSLIALLSLSSCGITSDKATEDTLSGKWVGVAEDSSEGIHSEIYYNFNSSSHTFSQTFDIFDLDDGSYIASIKLNGTWKASADKIEFKIDPTSINYEYGPDIDAFAFGQFTAEVEEELKNNLTEVSEIKSISKSSWTEVDDEGTTIVYERP